MRGAPRSSETTPDYSATVGWLAAAYLVSLTILAAYMLARRLNG